MSAPIQTGQPAQPAQPGQSEQPGPPTAPQPTGQAPTPPPATGGTNGDEPLGPAGLRALQAEREAKAAAERRAAELEARVQQFESANQTELQRAQSRAEQLERDLAAERTQRLRLQVATTHNIGADDLVLLTGSSEDELTAQAQRIAALNASRAAATAPPAFAPSPGQQAGNGTPAQPTATVDAGRELYRKQHKST